jgi:hypothetical protein
MVQKYGIEGLLVVSSGNVVCQPEKETAVVNGKTIKVFDRVKV